MDITARRVVGWALIALSVVLTIVTAADAGPAAWLAVAVVSLLAGIALLI